MAIFNQFDKFKEIISNLTRINNNPEVRIYKEGSKGYNSWIERDDKRTYIVSEEVSPEKREEARQAGKDFRKMVEEKHNQKRNTVRPQPNRARDMQDKPLPAPPRQPQEGFKYRDSGNNLTQKAPRTTFTPRLKGQTDSEKSMDKLSQGISAIEKEPARTAKEFNSRGEKRPELSHTQKLAQERRQQSAAQTLSTMR
jgi:hypothetical protein